MLLSGVTYGQKINWVSKIKKMKKISYADSPIEKTKHIYANEYFFNNLTRCFEAFVIVLNKVWPDILIKFYSDRL